MPINDDDLERVKAIRARAQERSTQGERLDTMADAEVIAALIDGTVSLDEIDDETLERCRKTFGASHIAQSIVMERRREGQGDPAPLLKMVQESESTSAVPKAPASRGPSQPARSWWRQHSHLLATAASLALVSMIVVEAGMHRVEPILTAIQQYVFNGVEKGPGAGNAPLRPGNDYATGLNIDFRWPSHPPFDPGTVKPWGPTKLALSNGLPDFSKESVTLGAGGEDPYIAWRLATVIIRTEEGVGSGTFVSSDGWLLTTYHVVEGSVQQASMTGSVSAVEVVVGKSENGRITPRPAVKAQVYRVDPVHDIALLKLEALPDGMKEVPFVTLAADIRKGEDGVVIGAQAKGQAWWVGSGNVSGLFDFPKKSSRKVVGSADTDNNTERTRATMVVTDIQISEGDSGGPLLNAKGELMGLTFAPPVGRPAGSIGWHIALKHLRGIVADLPSQPEAVPFDPWTIGLSNARLGAPQQADGDRDGRIDTLIFPYVADVMDSAGRTAPKAVAFTLFMDVSQRANSKPKASDLMPAGLWSREGRGSFRYDVFMTVRVDGKLVVGYTNATGVVDELRIGSTQTGKMTVKWQRTKQGEWWPSWPSIGTPFLDPAKIGNGKRRQIEAIYQNLVADQSGSNPSKLSTP